MEQQGNNHLTLEDLAEMVKRGFDGMATKEDLNELRMATKEDLNELRMATKEDLNELRMATKEDLNELRMETKEDFKMLLEELNATHVDVQYIRRTIDMLTQSDTAQDIAIDDLTTRMHHVEKKMGLMR